MEGTALPGNQRQIASPYPREKNCPDALNKLRQLADPNLLRLRWTPSPLCSPGRFSGSGPLRFASLSRHDRDAPVGTLRRADRARLHGHKSRYEKRTSWERDGLSRRNATCRGKVFHLSSFRHSVLGNYRFCVQPIDNSRHGDRQRSVDRTAAGAFVTAPTEMLGHAVETFTSPLLRRLMR